MHGSSAMALVFLSSVCSIFEHKESLEKSNRYTEHFSYLKRFCNLQSAQNYNSQNYVLNTPA